MAAETPWKSLSPPLDFNPCAFLGAGAYAIRIRAIGFDADTLASMTIAPGPATKAIYTEYDLPRPTNIRRVFVDNTSTPPTFWVGNNHGASILKLETLE